MKGEYVAFFDRGIGGLNLLSAFCRKYPSVRCLYYGDNTHAPYGNRSREEIARFAFSAFEEIASYPVAAAAIACNTVTACCAEQLRAAFPFPFVGMDPAVRPAAAHGGNILLLATCATLESDRFKALLNRFAGEAHFTLCCPKDLAGQIEKAAPDFSAVDLSFLPQGNFSAAVLGCTHYVFLEDRIARRLSCPVFDGILGTADHLFHVANICSKNEQKKPDFLPVFLGKAKKHNEKMFLTLF